MSNDANKRAAASEVVIATTLTALGFLTGSSPLMSLASIGAGIGVNWGASLLENSYRNWSREWFGRNGVLDDDINQALMQALQNAVKELEPELKEHQLYKRLRLYNREVANSLLANLVAIGDDAKLIVQNKPAMRQDMTSLMMGDQSQLETQLAETIKKQLSGYPSDFVDLTNFIRKRLTERWLHHFQQILNQPTEIGTKARVACQRLWQQSLIQALNQIGQNTTETNDTLNWLKTSAERQELQLAQLTPSVDIFVDALKDVLEQRLSKIEDNTSATLANTDEIKQDTTHIRTDTGQIKVDIKAILEQLEQMVEVSSEQNAIVEERSTEVLQKDTPHASKNPRAVILTALDVEYMAVRAHLTDLKDETHPNGTVYERGSFSAKNQTWDVGIVEIGAGNSPAALETERAIHYFDPSVVLFVGVAGGIKDVGLGDVVVATKVYGYESGKAEESFKARPEVGNSSYALVQRARAERRNKQWLQRIDKNSRTTAPRAFIGPIAAGEKIIASKRSSVRIFIHLHYNDALAVEMEGHGFLKAALANQHVKALIVRGISDLIEGKSHADAGDWQEIASRHASAFAFEVLANYII